MNETRKQKIVAVVQKRQSGIILVLEDIHDPHNAAAILRTCDGLGIQHVYFISEKEKPYDPKRIGKASSSSANKWLDFKTYTTTVTCLKELNKEGYAIIATALTSHSESLLTATFPEKKVAVLVGNEHAGLSKTALSLADRSILIPMMGFVQSFNVSVATAIMLWEITRQRHGTLMLSTKKQDVLLKDFLKRSGK
jgi:tRNA (guanosine-2'-O-)-methyltransferase